VARTALAGQIAATRARVILSYSGVEDVRLLTAAPRRLGAGAATQLERFGCGGPNLGPGVRSAVRPRFISKT